MIFYCVRHGESVYNREGMIQGWLDVPLSTLGESQAAAAGAALAELCRNEADTAGNAANGADRPAPERVFASPLRRAFQTAEAVSRALVLPVEPVESLREINVGEFQGQTRIEISKKYPDTWACWLSCDPDFALPGGETRRHLAERGASALRELSQLSHRAVVVVSHGAILTATFKLLMGIPLGHAPHALQNGSISTCELTRDGRFTMHQRDNIAHILPDKLSGSGDLPV